MAEYSTLVIDFTTETEGDGCGDRLLEIVDSSYAIGKRIEFKAWALTASRLNNLSMQYGASRPLGMGYLRTIQNSSHEESISFEGTEQIQLTYPAYSIISAVAKTDIIKIDNEQTGSTFATRGSNIASKLIRKGGSCIGMREEGYVLSGTIKIKYYKARCYRRWYFTPRSAGDYYFYMMENNKILKTVKVTIPEGETLAGSKVDKIICVKDYVSLVVQEDAYIYIDGVMRGQTDEDGCLLVRNLEAGAHTIRITKSGYLDSDEDDLANDEFTV